MALVDGRAQDVPMSVRMRQVLTSVRRMPPTDRVNLLVKAGLMPESEAQQAVDRLTSAEKERRKPKDGRGKLAKKAPKQSDA